MEPLLHPSALPAKLASFSTSLATCRYQILQILKSGKLEILKATHVCTDLTKYLAFYKVIYGANATMAQKEKLFLLFPKDNSVFCVSNFTASSTYLPHTFSSTLTHSGLVIRTLLPELFSSYIINASFVAS